MKQHESHAAHAKRYASQAGARQQAAADAGTTRMLMKCVTAALVALVGVESVNAQAPRLVVSENRRFLVRDDGRPFFWLGDTAWELFHRLNREDAQKYLEHRAKQGFTVIQAVVLAEFDGLNAPNAYRHKPLVENDPTRPNEEYFKHVDWIVDMAASLNLYVGMLPTWGDKWNAGKGKPLFNPENARAYGEFLGKRYRGKPVVWILGGDRNVDSDEQRATIKAMAEGLRKGDGGEHLITFHPTGGQGSSQFFHNEPWLDFNLRQNGHVPDAGAYRGTAEDYKRTPVKPVIDGEPLYEDHPIQFNADQYGHSTSADVRRPFYWNMFAGACGHTYGNHAVWQMYDKGRQPVNSPLMAWTEAIDRPAAMQMVYGRRLLESRPVLTRVPDDSVIVADAVKTHVPGAGHRRFVATRDSEGTYAMVYAPISRAFSVDMAKITGRKVRAWWYNPRTGEATGIGEFENTGTRRFVPPTDGELLDWVLVLDDAGRNYPPPGSR